MSPGREKTVWTMLLAAVLLTSPLGLTGVFSPETTTTDDRVESTQEAVDRFRQDVAPLINESRTLAASLPTDSAPDAEELEAFVDRAHNLSQRTQEVLAAHETGKPGISAGQAAPAIENRTGRVNDALDRLRAKGERIADDALALNESVHDPTKEGVELTKHRLEVGHRRQAQALGVDELETPGPVNVSRPSEEVQALFAAVNVSPTDEDWREMERMDEFNEELRDALARQFARGRQLVEVLQEASESVNEDELERNRDEVIADWLSHLEDPDASTLEAMVQRNLTVLPGMEPARDELARVLGHRLAFAKAAVDLDRTAEENPPANQSSVSLDGSGVGLLSDCRLFNLDLFGPDTYTHDYWISVELGGDDTYENNAGGNTCGGPCSSIPFSMFLDFGGDDLYGGSGNRRSCGVAAGAIPGPGGFGFGSILEFDGNDQYIEGSVAANGGALGGFPVVSSLLEFDGNDHYDAKHAATNGGSIALGISGFFEFDGADSYDARHAATNGGTITGIPLFFEFTGSDTYDAGSGGVNAGAIGLGVPLFFEFSGSDTYKSGSVAANHGSTALGLPLFFEFSGSDTYDAGSWASNGGSAFSWPAFGFEFAGADTYRAGSVGATKAAGVAAIDVSFEFSGNDDYTANGFGANGGAALVALEFFFESAGDDDYTADSLGVNGGAGLFAGARMAEGGGDDTYTADHLGANGGATGLAGAALLDASGTDTYDADDRGTNGGAWVLAYGLLQDGGTAADTYDVRDHGGNGGASWFALGHLVDSGGGDEYRAGDKGTDGGGNAVAIGDLLDLGGDDVHRAGRIATVGGGANIGKGYLEDRGGDDLYAAGERGVNGGASTGGNGTLIDVNGDDVYRASSHGVNGGGDGFLPLPVVFDSRGLLWDQEGNDQYLATRSAPDGSSGSFGVNGGGSHFGVGFLRDDAGNDSYVAVRDHPNRTVGDCGVNAGACAWGDGNLWDLGEGGDLFVARDRGTNGGIYNTEHQGTLLNQCGVDEYRAGVDGANGAAAWDSSAVDHVGAGKLLDLAGGGDRYVDGNGGTGVDKTVLTKPDNIHGLQIDTGTNTCGREPLPQPLSNVTAPDHVDVPDRP